MSFARSWLFLPKLKVEIKKRRSGNHFPRHGRSDRHHHAPLAELDARSHSPSYHRLYCTSLQTESVPCYVCCAGFQASTTTSTAVRSSLWPNTQSTPHMQIPTEVHMCSLLVDAAPAVPASHGVRTPLHCIVAFQSHLPHSSADSDSQENLVTNTMPRDTAISSPTSVMVRVSAGLMSASTWRTFETMRVHHLGTTTTLPRSD